MPFSERDAVELFHLLFLRQLAVGSERTLLTLKGGCNLRFFFRSIRYSEDMDLDVRVIARGTLKNKVNRLLESPALALPLRARGVSVVDVSAPKQTETTQRWKVGLALVGRSIPLRTKVELSRRGGPERTEPTAVEPVDGDLARAHGIPPPLLQHYTASAALTQKVGALIGRPETQARDVFDLQLLRAQIPKLPEIPRALQDQLPHAIQRVLSLSYDDYRSQVVAYLVPDQGAAFEDRPTWDAMQLEVVGLLEELGR